MLPRTMGAQFDPAVFLIFPVMLFSLSVHECAHALVAYWSGDDTGRLQGRITLNPISHIDVFGTIIMPILAALTTLPLIGWAKPVQGNLRRLRKPWYDVLVTLAGPGSNLMLAIIATLLMKAAVQFSWGQSEIALQLGFYFILTNVTLCIFNLIPIPPLDGSRVLFHYVINGRPQFYKTWDILERFSIIFLYLIISVGATRKLLSMATSGLAGPMLKFVGIG